MYKRFFSYLFLVFIFCSSVCAQQKNDVNVLYQQFINQEVSVFKNDSTVANKVSTFIVVIETNKQKAVIEKGQLKILRQLNDSVFIISSTQKQVLQHTDGIFLWIAKANENWKLSPSFLQQKLNKKIQFPLKTLVHVSISIDSLNKVSNAYWSFEKKVAENTYLLQLRSERDFTNLLQTAEVDFISQYSQHPQEELQINDLDLSANKINLLHSKLPLLNGEGMVVSIKENIPDTTDIDFAGRYIPNSLASTSINSHSTIMATMAAGAGNSWYLGKGVAWGASITSSDFSNLLPDASVNYQQKNITVQNHSYGVGIENFYGADAAAFDAAAQDNDKLIFVFSSGNKGNFSAPTGSYVSVNDFANLTGSFKMAKNIITVGATDSFDVVELSSSRGPAYDGRIKPEMVAYGKDGTSGAAALVSGTALVLQQAYKNNVGSLPSSSLVKAILLNSADDVGNSGIDFKSGFGSLNAYKATRAMLSGKYFTGTVASNGIQSFPISIPPNCSRVKCTLVWNDVAALPNAFTALVNDLDIELQSVSSGERWQPWVLNSFPQRDSLLQPAKRKRDSLNSVEQITIDNPAAGNYNIITKAHHLSASNQNFSIAWQTDSTNQFDWQFPSSADNIFSGEYNTIRWSSTFSSTTGRLEYSIDNGSNWQLINNNIDLTQKYYYWLAPDTNAIALLKMTVAAESIVSDTFTISQTPGLKVGFNCADSLLLYWTKINGANNYQLLSLGNKYLQPFANVRDTQIVVAKNIFTSSHVAIAPVIGNRLAVKSYTINFNQQATGCYINNLLADLVNGNEAHIQLSIGTTYQVKKIVIEKLKSNSFLSLVDISNVNGLNYDVFDTDLQKGENRYRVKIELINGQVIYSEVVTVFYFDNQDVIVYPTPVKQYGIINIQLKELQNQLLIVTDFMGRKVFQQIAASTLFYLPANFSKGMYYLQVFNPETKRLNNFRLLIF